MIPGLYPTDRRLRGNHLLMGNYTIVQTGKAGFAAALRQTSPKGLATVA
ncbi:hypothetical protein ANACOL_02883 [Anaerotruncus colihominis DSM 17241]|uniref:Uncharacterized protein n=1 Tax=Anaerotruncus colihominis DSM 17241 TaxID=445972 RepID=B0PE94_9FIRM|nr:hypothetical protein ANACOL_02883 [Anaerotruncus colihominis DSM 17241]